MKILILSDYNIGGQCTALMRAINRHTKHQARCAVVYDDTFAYDHDLVLSRSEEEMQEAARLALEWADFYHFGSYIFNFPGVDFNKQVNPRNCCVKYYGSYLRDNGPQCREFHRQSKIAAITGTDWSITSQLDFSFYHLASYFTKYGDEAPAPVPLYKPGETFRICAGSAGHPNKRYEVLARVVEELQDEGLKLDLDFIHGVSNQEALERKRNAHATFCSLHGGWGISGIESFFLGHVVFTCLDPFVLSMFPETPTAVVDEASLKAAIRDCVTQPGLSQLLQLQGPKFAKTHFNNATLVRKYLYTLQLIQGGEKYRQGFHAAEVIY